MIRGSGSALVVFVAASLAFTALFWAVRIPIIHSDYDGENTHGRVLDALHKSVMLQTTIGESGMRCTTARAMLLDAAQGLTTLAAVAIVGIMFVMEK